MPDTKPNHSSPNRKTRAWNKLIYELEKGERSAQEKGWYTHEEAMKELRARIAASNAQ